jgi:NADPH2:quinone reductase
MGIVVEVGANVGTDWIGRRVAWFAQQPPATGTYAEFAAVPAAALLTLPDAIDDITAAAIPLQGLTAHVLVHCAARIRDGQTVLIHAAAGGIGLLAVQMMKRLGARVLGTISSDAKAAAVREAGGEPFVRGDDLVERVKAATNGRGVDVVLDSIGLPTQAASLAMLAPFGELVFFGDAGGMPKPVDPDSLYPRSLKVSAFGLDLDADPAATDRARRELVAWAADGTLKFRIDRVLPLAEAAEAHRLLEAGANVGKIVLVDPR